MVHPAARHRPPDAKTGPRMGTRAGSPIPETPGKGGKAIVPEPDQAVNSSVEVGGPGDFPRAPDATEPSVELLIQAMSERLYIEDDAHIWVSCACALSNYLDAAPLWIMIVGSPSGGKTEMVDALGHVADYQIKDLTEASLLSWSSRKRAFVDATGTGGTARDNYPTGILIRVGERGFVTFSDYSTVLAFSDHGRREGLFSALRTIYDGEYSRDQGTRLQPLVWAGRLTFLAACTQVIDHYTAHNSVLGDRWLYVRLPEMDQKTELEMQRKAMLAYGDPDDGEWDKAVRYVADEAIKDALPRLLDTAVPESVMDEISRVAYVSCLGRAGVKRDRGEIVGYPIIERMPRMTKQLMTLAKCLLALEAGEDRTVALCKRVALDSMPEQRRRVLEVLVNNRLGDNFLLNTASVSRLASLNRTATRKTLEDLQAIGLVESDQADDPEEHNGQRGAARFWLLASETAEMVVSTLGARQ
jgi:hypothetical protein